MPLPGKTFSLVRKLLFFLALAGSVPMFAQDGRVESGSYRFMLKTLLSHTVPEIDVATAAAADNSTLFLDARERNEYDVSHIRGALWVGYDDFNMARLAGVPKETPLVVYCSVGYRSEKISERLIAAGYTSVANLYGGVFEWKNQDHSVVDPQGQPTEEVHAFNRTWGIWLKEGEKVYKD